MPPTTIAVTPQPHDDIPALRAPVEPLLTELAARTRELVPGQAHVLLAREHGALLTLRTLPIEPYASCSPSPTD